MSTITISAGLSTARPVRSARAIRPTRPIRPARRPAVPAPALPARGVRLTRRGRLLLTLVALVTTVAAGVLAVGGPPATAGTDPGDLAAAELVTVRPGETLWAIAEREVPGVDPRQTIAEIVDLNHLESSAVQAGSVLLLPR